MAIHIKCPKCQGVLTVPDVQQGRQVRCPLCQQVTLVPGPKAPAAIKPAAANKPAGSSEAVTKNPPSLGAPNPRRARLDDDEPRQKSRSRREVRSERDITKRSALPWILASVIGLVVLAGGTVVFFVMMGNAPPDVVAQNPPPAAAPDQPILAPTPEPAAPAQPAVPQPAVGAVAPPQNVSQQPLAKPVQPAPQPVPPAAVQPAPPPPAKQAAVPAGPVPDKIDQEAIRRVKKATAHLRVYLGNNRETQGSGFFAVESGLVFTNAHVLGMLKGSSTVPSKVDVVVHSGEKEEFTRQGRVLGVDRECDLGILRIDDAAGLPEPLPVDSTRNLSELQEVYIFGFPFGSTLGKNITVSKSSISSLRKDADGTVQQVQVLGGMNPGNSGGPVVDSRGVVIGVSVAIIQGTQINFAVPGEKVHDLLRGRVSDVNLGESYLSNGKIKLPIEVTTLDPLNRLQDVKLDVWLGSPGAARPPSLERPTGLPGEGVRQTISLAYQGNKGTTEIELPAATPGQAFWIQPILTDRAGVSLWSTATPYKVAEHAPLERKAVLLQQVFDSQAERTVKFGTAFRDSKSMAGKAATFGLNLEMDAVETAQKEPRGGMFRLFTTNARMTIEIDGKPSPESPTVTTLSLFKGKTFTYVTNPTGGLIVRSVPGLSGFTAPALRQDFEDFAMDLSNSYEMTLMSVPNREVQPKESWQSRLPFFINGSGKRKEVADMHLTCTLEGVRISAGQQLALISVNGNVVRRIGGGVSSGKITGKVHFDVDKGYIAKVKLKKEPSGGDGNDTSHVEIVLTRTPGNSTGVTPPAVPPAPTPLAKAPLPSTPVPTTPAPPSAPVPAKGTTVLQETGVLGPADLANYPARAGIPYKAFKVNLVAGKTYLLEMNKTDASTLDPCLILHNAQNQKLAATEKGGAEKASLLFKAPASEVCVVFATTVGADKLGAFQLIVAEIPENQPAVAGNAPVPGNELLKGGKQYIPKNGRFTVTLPRGNSTGERTRTLRINNLPLSMEQAYSSVNGGNAYVAASITLPAAALRDLPEGQRLDTFRDVLLSQHGQVVDTKDLRQGAFPGKDYIAEGPRGAVRMQLYTAGNKIFLALVESPSRAGVQSAVVDAFFASFRLTQPGEAPPAQAPIAANPNAPPQPPGQNQAAGNFAKSIKGDTFAFVQTAVKTNRLGDVDVSGFKASRVHYRETLPEGGLLIGFHIGLGKFANKDVIHAICPIYRTQTGEKMGAWIGPQPANPLTLKAKDGYVVGGLTIRTALLIDGMSVNFVKFAGGALQPEENYNSMWAGSQNSGTVHTIGGRGQIAVGVTGHLNNSGNPCSLGLLAVLDAP